MNREKLSIIVPIFLQFVQILALPASSNAQDVVKILNYTAALTQIDGFYIYKLDGSPVLGIIIARLDEPQVKFRTCQGDIIDISSKDLAPSLAKCSPENPRKNRILPLVVDGDKLVPKKEFTRNTDFAAWANEKVDIGKLPASYQATLSKLKSGEWAALVYESDKGKKEFGVFTKFSTSGFK
jgi:hypothetical protein